MTMNKTKLIKIAIILIYLFSPIDILPEAVLGPLGLVDDAAAIALLIRILLKNKNLNKINRTLLFSFLQNSVNFSKLRVGKFLSSSFHFKRYP